MAHAPDHITITVDQEALRKQIQEIVTAELREASYSLRRAADALDPMFMQNHNTWMEEDLRAKWEAEQA